MRLAVLVGIMLGLHKGGYKPMRVFAVIALIIVAVILFLSCGTAGDKPTEPQIVQAVPLEVEPEKPKAQTPADDTWFPPSVGCGGAFQKACGIPVPEWCNDLCSSPEGQVVLCYPTYEACYPKK